jgi:PAS domain S-box-containing protein
MKNNVASAIETIVHTLLQVGERVVEVNRDEVICGIWYREGEREEDHLWKKLKEVNADSLLAGCSVKVKEAFKTGQNGYLEQAIQNNNREVTYGIRILPIHPDKDKLFLVIEQRGGKAITVPEIDTEKKLEKQRAFYERILNNVAADIVVLDNEYRFLYVNPGAVPDEEIRKWLIGKTDEEYFRQRQKPMTIPERRKKMYEAARNERRMIEWVERSVDVLGNIKHTLRRVYPVFDEKERLDIIIGYSMSISEMVAVQEALKTSKDTFESAFHDSGIGMAMLSPDGKWLDANRVMCEMTGYSRDKLMHVHIRDITHPEERRENKALVKKMLSREIPSFTRERRYISRQGKIVQVLFTLSLVWGKDDEPKFFIAQAVDITKMKDLEAENTRKNAELEAAKAHLLNKVSQLEELSYIIAHNLRGPAANIKLLTDALLAKNNKDSQEGNLSGAFTVEEGLTFIQDASTSLMNSLASLMKIAEIKLNKAMPMNDCDVNVVVNDVTTQLQSAIFEKRAKIDVELGVEFIKYPRAYLESILYNFISNALKYAKPGIVPEILISTKMVGERVQLSVKDNGLGLDMARHGDKMFKLNQVFHSGHDSKGFGLYLTKTQVESLGGSISVTSREGEGSEFVVTL